MAMTIRSLNMKAYRNHLLDLMTGRCKAVEAGDLEHNIPTFVWGPPGIGKSMILASICKDSWMKATTDDGKGNKVAMYSEKMLMKHRPWDASNWSFYTAAETKEFDKHSEGYILMDVRLSQVDPVEIKGAPFYDTVNMKAGFIRFNSILPDPKSTHPIFLLLDEFPLASDMVQSAGYQLINDRKVGDYRLPDRCIVIAAGNRPEDGGVHFEMSIALENRFDHIALDIDYDGFVKYMANGHGYDETLIAFLQFNKEQDKNVLYKLDQGKGNFPTFRSWEKSARKIKYGGREADAISDSVGQACAAKFETFKEFTKDIPDVDVILKKGMYFDRVELQLVANQKVGNELINKEKLVKTSPDKAFDIFQYFVNMKNPKDVNDKREELTILFLVNIKDELEILDKIDKGFQKALKSGAVKMEKNPETGENIVDIYGMIFFKWHTLSDLD
jgi:hypothetical protein